MAPTSIDGTDISSATIDGTDVSEITVDGDVVYSSGKDLPDKNNLVAFWTADDEDTSKLVDQQNGHDASWNGSVSFINSDLPSNGGKAADVPESTYAEVDSTTDDTTIDFNQKSFTFLAYLKHQTPSDVRGIVAAQAAYSYGGTDGWFISTGNYDNRTEYGYHNGDTTDLDADLDTPTGEWYWIAIVCSDYESLDYYTYVKDKTLNSSGTISNRSRGTSEVNTMRFGQGFGRGGADCLVDEAHYYDVAKTQTEIENEIAYWTA